MSIRISMIILLFVILVGGQQLGSQTKANPGGFDLVDETGNIRKPPDYRDRYRILGVYGSRSEGRESDAQHVRVARDSGVLPEERKVRGWNGTGQGSLRHRSRATDDRRRALGLGNESLVRDDQGRKRPLPKQSALGRRVGMGALQIRCARQAGRDGLQERLPGLPHSRAGNRLDLRPRLSGSQVTSKSHVVMKRLFKKRSKEICDAKVFVAILAGLGLAVASVFIIVNARRCSWPRLDTRPRCLSPMAS